MRRIVPKISSWWRAINIISPWRLPLRYQLKILISFIFLICYYAHLCLLLFWFKGFFVPLLLRSQHLVLELGIQHLGRMVDWRRWRRWPSVPYCVFGNVHLTFLLWWFKQIQVWNHSFWCLLAPFFHIFTIFNWIRECANSFAILFLSCLFNLGHN